MNSEYVVGSRNLAEEVLAANSLETNVDFVSRTVFNLARNDKHARMIFKAVEDQGFPVGIGHTIYFICACRKSLATNHELEGYSHGDLVSNLGPCGYAQPSKTEKDNQNTQTMLSHHFSFERVVIDDCRFETFIPEDGD